ncbi:hypothetical protein [Domibacillus indicus]|uniref:hypothetical protein n=1 Tax=Domibacillus indicus TaxID=1437523 RepID=UPI0006182447|nr:hypothetical protein [Domibacillus indicus]
MTTAFILWTAFLLVPLAVTKAGGRQWPFLFPFYRNRRKSFLWFEALMGYAAIFLISSLESNPPYLLPFLLGTIWTVRGIEGISIRREEGNYLFTLLFGTGFIIWGIFLL